MDRFVYRIPNAIYIPAAILGIALILIGFFKDNSKWTFGLPQYFRREIQLKPFPSEIRRHTDFRVQFPACFFKFLNSGPVYGPSVLSAAG